MCSPDYSFVVSRAGKAYTTDGDQGHALLAKRLKLDEDKLIKINYDWVKRSWEYDAEAPFEPKQSHIMAINQVITKKFGTPELLLKTLSSMAKNDIQVFDKLRELLKGKAQREWEQYSKIVNSKTVCNDGIKIHMEARNIMFRKFVALFSDSSNRVSQWS